MVETSDSGSAAALTNSDEIRRQISETTRQIDGRTENTEINDGPAIRIFDIYRKVFDKCPLDEITYAEVNGEMLEFLIVNYLAWLATTPIPCKLHR